MRNLKTLNVIVGVLTALSYVAQGALMIFGKKQAQMMEDAKKQEWMKEVIDQIGKK